MLMILMVIMIKKEAEILVQLLQYFWGFESLKTKIFFEMSDCFHQKRICRVVGRAVELIL